MRGAFKQQFESLSSLPVRQILNNPCNRKNLTRRCAAKVEHIYPRTYNPAGTILAPISKVPEIP